MRYDFTAIPEAEIPQAVDPVFQHVLQTYTSEANKTVSLHSRADDVVPFADNEELARTNGAALFEMGTDHRFADSDALAVMLTACEKV